MGFRLRPLHPRAAAIPRRVGRVSRVSRPANARAPERGMGLRLRRATQRPPRSRPSTTSTRANTTTTGRRLARRERAQRRGRRGRRRARPCGWSTWVGADASGRASARVSQRRPPRLRAIVADRPTARRGMGSRPLGSVPSWPCGRAARGLGSRARRRPARDVRGPGSRCDAGATIGSARAGRQAAVHPAPAVARSTGRGTPDRRRDAGVTVAAPGAAWRAGDGGRRLPRRRRRSGGVASLDCVEGSLSAGE